MSYNIVISTKAHAEYIQAYEWYEAKQEGLGERFEIKLEEMFEYISQYPLYFNIKKLRYREAKIPVFPFLIVYEIIEKQNTVFVSAIHHAKRNPKRKYTKRK